MAERMNAQTNEWRIVATFAAASIGRLQPQLGAEQGESECEGSRQEEG